MRRTEGSTRYVEPTVALNPPPWSHCPTKEKGRGGSKRERERREIFVPLSFHCRSSKDQSLLKINLKENF